MKTLILTEKDLENLARQILQIIAASDHKTATVLALRGDLGSGKTTFTKSLAKLLGIEESITSPTFVIQKTFNISDDNLSQEKVDAVIFDKYKKLIHIDSYRIDLSDELLHLGWNDTLSEPSNLIVLEWPERVADILPPQYIELTFEHVDETTRSIEVKFVDNNEK